jgi:hypothetical protein
LGGVVEDDVEEVTIRNSHPHVACGVEGGRGGAWLRGLNNRVHRVLDCFGSIARGDLAMTDTEVIVYY